APWHSPCDGAPARRGRTGRLRREHHGERGDAAAAARALRAFRRGGGAARRRGPPHRRSRRVAPGLYAKAARGADLRREAGDRRDAMEGGSRRFPSRQARGSSGAQDCGPALRVARRSDPNSEPPQGQRTRLSEADAASAPRRPWGPAQSLTKNCFLKRTVKRLASLIGVASTVKISVSPSVMLVSPM